MKVRTFSFGLASGLPEALKLLDEKVEKLGDVTIHSVQDALYEDINLATGQTMTEKLMVRVVIYTPKE